MLTLVIKQTLSSGVKKVWRLRPNTGNKTFGSSRLADVISIDPLAKGIQGVFEYQDNKWWYTDLDRAHTQSDDNPTQLIQANTTLKLDGSTLQLEVLAKDLSVFDKPEKFSVETRKGSVPYTLYVVKYKKAVIETKVLPRGEKFTSALNGHPDVQITEKHIELSDAADMMKLNPRDYFDDENRKGAYALLAAAFLILGIGLFSPKQEQVTQVTTPPRATKIVIMTDAMKKKRGLEITKKMESKPQPVQVAQTPPTQKPTGGKAANNSSFKTFSASRISQMLGKVSAQAAKTDNIIVSTRGVVASPDQGGRALAALGPISKPGTDWSKETKGSGAGVSTTGKGGGHGTAGMGSLTGGNTGQAGVGLIEDESEIVGGLDRDLIAQYIKTQLGQILYCYERQLSASPKLEGKVSVRFTIGSSGKVEEQNIGDTTLRNATVEGCILNRVAQWKFPNPQGGTKVNVTYPFLFKSTN